MRTLSLIEVQFSHKEQKRDDKPLASRLAMTTVDDLGENIEKARAMLAVSFKEPKVTTFQNLGLVLVEDDLGMQAVNAKPAKESDDKKTDPA
jgi:hypothetical protein